MFQVVDKFGQPQYPPMWRQANAQAEADRLNISGVPEGRPYVVIEVAE